MVDLHVAHLPQVLQHVAAEEQTAAHGRVEGGQNSLQRPGDRNCYDKNYNITSAHSYDYTNIITSAHSYDNTNIIISAYGSAQNHKKNTCDRLDAVDQHGPGPLLVVRGQHGLHVGKYVLLRRVLHRRRDRITQRDCLGELHFR